MPLNPSVLIGQSLNDGWVIDRHQTPYDGATGARHSLCYIALRDIAGKDEKEEAFVKALDPSIDPNKADPLPDLKYKVDVFLYERDLVEKCQIHHMSKIVRAIDHGQLSVNGYQNPVFYILFELADSDLRKQTEIDQRFDLAFQFRVLQRTATGLQQLHAAHISHQDLKPSNVLVFKNDDTKLADLGHARDKTKPRPGVDNPIAGDPTYAPPEQIYGFKPDNWAVRRLAGDLYHLGSLVVYLLTGVGATTGIQNHLKPEHQCGNWSGTNYDEILPYLRDATDAIIEEAIESVPQEFKERLASLLVILLEPDPLLRNHPRNRAGSGALYGLERFVSGFNLLAKKAEHSLKEALTV